MEALTHSLPVTIRLPLFAAAMIFLAAVTSTQSAIFFMSRQIDYQVETLGNVYLDGLSAALLPYVRQGERLAALEVMENALQFHQGIIDRRLIFLDTNLEVVAQVARSDVASDSTIPADIRKGESSGLVTDSGGVVWIWRALHDDTEKFGTIVANLDVSTFHRAWWGLRWVLLSFDLIFSSICAILGFYMVRRLQRPLAILARRLYSAALGQISPIEQHEMPAGDHQALQMFQAFNAMSHSTREKEALLTHLASKERDAVLGRLVATIAHEIRNPLGGMRTAISTLKRYGDEVIPRMQALDFLERGVQALEGVVDATLESYRTRPQWRRLSKHDFEDLRLLIDADGRSHGVTIDVSVDVPDEMPIAALEVRQVLLNLLLNAIRASSKGNIVRLHAGVRDGMLHIEVEDEGSGLDPNLAQAMEAGDFVDGSSGLGVAVVVRLVERLQGRVAVKAQPGSGTSITLSFPLREERNIK